MTTPADVFRTNLQKLAKLRQLDRSALEAKGSFRGEDRKWLDRAWNKGLQRPDPRTENKLGLLAELLGIDDYNVLWDSTYEPSPYVLIEAADDWKQLVYDILWKHQLYQHAKLRQRSIVRAAAKAYGNNETLFIADWIAYERGLDRMTDADLGMITDALRELHDELLFNFRLGGSIFSYVRDRAVQHPNWPRFEAEAVAGQRFDSDDEQQAVIEQALLDLVQDLQYRTLTPPEVCEQFIEIYLEGRDAPVRIQDSVLKNILELLHEHPNWETYVEVHHNGSIESCEAHFARMWREAVEMFGVTVTPESFVSYIVKCNFDFGETNRVSRSEAKSDGLSVKARKTSL